MMKLILSFLCLTVVMESTRAFVTSPSRSFGSSSYQRTKILFASEEAWNIESNEPTEEEIERLFEEVDEALLKRVLEPTEKAWRHAKKVLLRIGSKGATLTHGNSLRQLLEQHQVVKVKINTRKFGTFFTVLCRRMEHVALDSTNLENSQSTLLATTNTAGGLADAFIVLRDLAVEAGAPEGIELIQSRDIENTILFGLPGTLEAIESGAFPPAEVIWVPRTKEEKNGKARESK